MIKYTSTKCIFKLNTRQHIRWTHRVWNSSAHERQSADQVRRNASLNVLANALLDVNVLSPTLLQMRHKCLEILHQRREEFISTTKREASGYFLVKTATNCDLISLQITIRDHTHTHSQHTQTHTNNVIIKSMGKLGIIMDMQLARKYKEIKQKIKSSTILILIL